MAKAKTLSKRAKRIIHESNSKNPPPPKDVRFTVMFPEGIRLQVNRTFCTDVVPKGTILRMVGAHQAKDLHNHSVGYVELRDAKTGRTFRLEYEKLKHYERGEGLVQQ